MSRKSVLAVSCAVVGVAAIAWWGLGFRDTALSGPEEATTSAGYEKPEPETRASTQVAGRAADSGSSQPEWKGAGFDQLIRDAKSNPQLAYRVSGVLLECINQGLALDASEDLADAGIPQAAAEALNRIEQSDEVCTALSSDQKNQLPALLEIAADGGVLEAQLNYSTIVAQTILSPDSIANPEKIERYKRKSMEYYHKAAAAGSPDALMSLSTAYADGILAHKDQVQAYRYAYAYSLASPSPSANKWLDQLGKGLSSEEVRNAKLLAGRH